MQGHYIVAGASRGIGAAVARHLEQAGATVTGLSRSQGVDLCDPLAAEAAIDAAYHAHGPIMGLVCTAGAAQQAPLSDLSAASLRAGMEAKYFPYVHAIMPCLKWMLLHGQGTIVPVIGMGGKVASPTHLPGGAANAALMLLTTGLGQAYAPQGIRVLGLNPGLVATDRFELAAKARALNEGISLEAARHAAAASLPRGQITSPEEIASLVAFLLSPASVALNGTVLSADAAATAVL